MVIVLACIVYAWFFGPQTFFALLARRTGRQVPIVKSVPVELEDLSVSTTRGAKLSFQEAEFEVPWDDVDEQKTRIVGKWVGVRFRSGRAILLCVGPQDGFIGGLAKDKNIDPNSFASLYGSEVLRSDYTLFKAIYETTPSQISLFTPASRAAGLSSVMIVKALIPPTTDWAIYNIRSKDAKGFQLGSPTRRPKKMCLELFTGNVEFEITLFQSETGPIPAITQAEINRIIQTAHKAELKQPVLTVSPL